MAFPTFTPPVGPSPGTKHQPITSLNTAEFGDGYRQASPRGLNHIRQKAKFKWDGLLEADMKTIRSFFEARGGYQPFWYQPHGFDAPLKWICKTWAISDQAPWRVTAEFEESFEPES